MHIYICEFDEYWTKEVLLKKAQTLPFALPEGEISGRKWEHLRQRIIAWSLLSYGWEREFQEPFPADLVKRTTKGKPYLEGRTDLYFNLSHCNTACACVLSRQESGIDIESRFSFRPALARKVCHANEKGLLDTFNEEEKESCLQRLWSLKESYVKYTGTGITINLSDLDFSISDSNSYCMQKENYTMAVYGSNAGDATLHFLKEKEITM